MQVTLPAILTIKASLDYTAYYAQAFNVIYHDVDCGTL